jgi:hypothetical protein
VARDWLAATTSRVVNFRPGGTPRPSRPRTVLMSRSYLPGKPFEYREMTTSRDWNPFGHNPGAASPPLAMATNCVCHFWSCRMFSSAEHCEGSARFAQADIGERSKIRGERLWAPVERQFGQSGRLIGGYSFSAGERSRAISRMRRRSSLPAPRCGKSSTAKN